MYDPSEIFQTRWADERTMFSIYSRIDPVSRIVALRDLTDDYLHVTVMEIGDQRRTARMLQRLYNEFVAFNEGIKEERLKGVIGVVQSFSQYHLLKGVFGDCMYTNNQQHQEVEPAAGYDENARLWFVRGFDAGDVAPALDFKHKVDPYAAFVELPYPMPLNV